MERIVIAHLGGSKADQEEKFPLSDFNEITIGRDPASSVRYGEDPGTVVSRRHARITRNIAFPSQFFITDLNSRNGTFVNGQRVLGTTALKPGDVVQCGVGGPQFRFIIELETDQLIQSSASTADLIEPERARHAPLPLADSSSATIEPVVQARDEWSSAPAQKSSVGRLIAVSGVMMGAIALGAGFFFYRNQGEPSGFGGEALTTVTTPQPVVSPTAEASPVTDVEKSGQGKLPAAEAAKNAQATPPAITRPVTNAARPTSKVGVAIPPEKTMATRNSAAAPPRRKVAGASSNKIVRPGSARITNTGGGKVTAKGAAAARISSKGRETINSDSYLVVSDKKAAKKAKKEKEKKLKTKP